jgi:hypothetical protein
MYLSPTKLRKKKYKHRKTLASATCFDSNIPHIFSYFSKIRININSTTVTYNLSLNIKFKNNTLNGSLKTIPRLISVKLVFINVVLNEQIVFRQLKICIFLSKSIFQACPCCKTIRKINNFT